MGRVLVLGCGPAGLFAAHAAKQLGYSVDIISKKRRSEMFGAQYLHASIPGLTDDQKPFHVEYRLNGTLDAYLHKVYGEHIPDPGKITVESLVGRYPAWDIRRAYLRAWDLYGRSIIPIDRINALNFSALTHGTLPYSHVISTIPQTDLCYDSKHTFNSRNIWALGDAPERGQFVPERFLVQAADGIIQYDGTPERSWYRVSNIAGYCAVEWPYGPGKTIAPYANASLVVKPVHSDCDCWGSLTSLQFIRIGRYGAWHRTGHTHQAYWRILAALKGIE